jgi:hypothetical protein
MATQFPLLNQVDALVLPHSKFHNWNSPIRHGLMPLNDLLCSCSSPKYTTYYIPLPRQPFEAFVLQVVGNTRIEVRMNQHISQRKNQILQLRVHQTEFLRRRLIEIMQP